MLDQTAPIRKGEELDLEAVKKYLLEEVPGLKGDIAIEQFPSGHSNLTYFVKVGEREMVLRRPPFGSKVKSAHDMSREYKILSAIHPVYDRVPRPLAYCEDESVIGAKFYVMDRIRGLILRRTLPEGLTLPPETAGRLARNLIRNLAEIHAIDYEAVGLGAIAKVEGFLARQVKGWADRYYGSRTHDIPGVERVITQLKDAPGNNQAAICIGGWAPQPRYQHNNPDLPEHVALALDTDNFIDPGTGERDPACLRVVDFRLDQENTLHMSVYFRSWDLWGGFPANLAGLQLVKEYVGQTLDAKDGKIIAASKGLHIYDHAVQIAATRLGLGEVDSLDSLVSWIEKDS